MSTRKVPQRAKRRVASASPASRTQRGFSLIEIAVALAATGVLIGMALKSQELLEQYRQSQFVTQVQTLVANARAHRINLGRWPGDCNRDGLVDYPFSTADLDLLRTGDPLDYAVSTQLNSAATSSSFYALGNVCPPTTLQPFEQINVPFNELKRTSLSSPGEPNRKSASHSLDGFAYLGSFETAPSATPPEQQFNALVLTEVPIQAVRRLALAIDGYDGSAANTGRVRRTKDLETFEALWTAGSETELARVTVVVFFDRIPP